MSSGYHVFEWVAVLAIVGLAGWRVWRSYTPKRAGDSEPGCDAGCPSCNQCATTPDTVPPKNEQPIEFHPRPR